MNGSITDKLHRLISQDLNICVLGQAGTGKTSICVSAITSSNKAYKMCASTGIAAVQLRGTTIHSFCGLKAGCSTAELEARIVCQPEKLEQLRKTELLYIDEISMISAHTFSLAEKAFRIAKQNDQPFGGVQLLVSGDFWQLQPVQDLQCSDTGEFPFTSEAWRAMEFHYVELTEVVRHADDILIKCVHDLARGIVPENLDIYKFRPAPPPLHSVWLFGTNSEVDFHNMYLLHQLDGELYKYEAVDHGSRRGLECVAPKFVCLKLGVPVLLTVNLSIDQNLVNGKKGSVVALHSEWVTVKFDGATHVIKPYKFMYRNSCRTQVPLKLCWGRTIHRSQGLTLEELVHVMASNICKPGQLSVAISRTDDSDKLSIGGNVKIISPLPKVVKFYEELHQVQQQHSDDSSESLSDESDSDNGDVTGASQSIANSVGACNLSNEDIIWQELTRFRETAKNSNDAISTYCNLVATLPYSDVGQHIISRLGRTDAWNLFSSVRQKFMEHYQEESMPLASNNPSYFLKHKDNSDANKLRKMAGYFVYRLADQLKTLLRKESLKGITYMLETKAMIDFVEAKFKASREEVLEEDGVGEVEFFQNANYSLTHVTQDCLDYFNLINEFWYGNININDSRTVPTVKQKLLDNDHIFRNLTLMDTEQLLTPNTERNLYSRIIKIFVGSAAYELRRHVRDNVQKKKTLRIEVYASRKKQQQLQGNVELCGVCGLSDDLSRPGDNWIQCDVCAVWIHQQCLNWDDTTFESMAAQTAWQCEICRDCS